MRSLTTLACTVLAASAQAQLTVLLPHTAGTSGIWTPFPWGINSTAWPGMRSQCFYDNSHFAGAGVRTPILIDHVRWRALNVATTTTWTGGTYSQATLSLGTAPIDYWLASTTWASNVGPDYQVVYSGPVTVQPGAGTGAGVPGQVVVDITLTTPFLYDPSLGDLIVDTEYLFPGNWTGGTQVAMAVHTTNAHTSMVYSSSLYPTANGIVGYAPTIEIGYTLGGGGGPVIGTNTTTGDGCVRAYTSVYENFAPAASFDLSNSSISMLPTGGGYTLIPGLYPFVAPTAAAALVAVGDDVQQTVPIAGLFPYPGGTTGALTVHSNGVVSVAIGNLVAYFPGVGNALHFAQTSWGDWHDYYPIGGTSGNVKFEQAGSVVYITWDAVVDYASTTTPNTWQFQFDTATGIVSFVFGTMSLAGGNHLVYYSPGGPSAIPGNTDLSVALPASITLAANDVLALALAAGTRPIVGTNWNLNVTNVPATGTVGLEIFGLADPNMPDLAFLGAPGCGIRASLDVVNAWLVAGAAHPYSLSIPNNLALLNLHVFTNAAVLQPGVNTLLGGVITSNGIDGRIGNY